MPPPPTPNPDAAPLPPDVEESMRMIVTALLRHYRETKHLREATAGEVVTG